MTHGRRPRAAIASAGATLVLRGGLVVAVLAAAAACGAVVPADGSGGNGAAPTASSPPGSGVTAAAVTQAGRDGHVCLGRRSKDPYGGDLPRADQRPRLGPAEPARLVRCRVDSQRIGEQGEWQVRIEEQAGAGGRALAAALRLPDETPSEQACAAYADLPPDLWAVDASGRAVLVREPVDGCGHIRAEVKQALEGAGWRETGRRRLGQTVPQAALDSGCEIGWKDMAAVDAQGAGGDASASPAATADALAKAAGGKVCVYRVDERGQTPSGSFVSGRPLRRAAWAAVVRALDAAPRLGAACATPGTMFAVVLTQRPDPAYVELDGCRRVLLPGGGGLRRATPALVRFLTTP